VTKSFGFDLLQEQILDQVASQIAFRCGSTGEGYGNYGDTPIERLLFTAVVLRLEYVKDTWYTKAMFVESEKIERFKTRKDASEWLIVEKQAQLPGWRVDFIVHALASWRRNPGGGTPGWKRLIVECDGHDFHERTKEQAAKDRSRDREAQEQGYEIFRFTGSELWKDPLGCAKQVIDWAESKL
jgi:very-short-patch-repair endonuclease